MKVEKFRLRAIELLLVNFIGYMLLELLYLESFSEQSIYAIINNIINIKYEYLLLMLLTTVLVILTNPIVITSSYIKTGPFRKMNWDEVKEVKVKRILWIKYMIILNKNSEVKPFFVHLWVMNFPRFKDQIIKLSGREEFKVL